MRNSPFIIGVTVVFAACGGGDSSGPTETQETATLTPSSEIQVLSGDEQADTPFVSLDPIRIQLTTNDLPLEGETVTFHVPEEGCGAPFSGAATTDEEGRAAEIWELGTAAGPCAMQVRAVQSDGTPVVYGSVDATILPGKPVGEPSTQVSRSPQSKEVGEDFVAGNVLDSLGETVEVDLSNLPHSGAVQGDSFWLHYSISVRTGDAGSTGNSSLYVVVSVDTDNGDGWIERATLGFNASSDGEGVVEESIDHRVASINVSELSSDDRIRVRVDEVDPFGEPGGSFEVHGFNQPTDGDATSGLVYNIYDQYSERSVLRDDYRNELEWSYQNAVGPVGTQGIHELVPTGTGFGSVEIHTDRYGHYADLVIEACERQTGWHWKELVLDPELEPEEQALLDSAETNGWATRRTHDVESGLDSWEVEVPIIDTLLIESWPDEDPERYNRCDRLEEVFGAVG